MCLWIVFEDEDESTRQEDLRFFISSFAVERGGKTGTNQAQPVTVRGKTRYISVQLTSQVAVLICGYVHSYFSYVAASSCGDIASSPKPCGRP